MLDTQSEQNLIDALVEDMPELETYTIKITQEGDDKFRVVIDYRLSILMTIQNEGGGGKTFITDPSISKCFMMSNMLDNFNQSKFLEAINNLP